LKVLEGEGRARRDRVNANQERVSTKIALNLSVWSLVAWVSHLTGSLSAAPRDYFTALRFDIISVEERERAGVMSGMLSSALLLHSSCSVFSC